MGKKVDLNSRPKDQTTRRQHLNNNNHIGNHSFTNSTSSENIGEEQDNNNQGVGKNNRLLGGVSSLISGIGSKNSTEKITVKFPIKLLISMLPILMIIFVFSFLLIFSVFVSTYSDATAVGAGESTKNYYAPECEDITVLILGNNDELEDSITIPLEDYVAGVVNAEVGSFNNSEIFKEFAIVARSHVLYHEDNCTIESSDREQRYEATTDEDIIKAVNTTAGQVLLSDGELVSVSYDEFACSEKDNNYYTLSQANQKLPVSWVNSTITVDDTNRDWFTCDSDMGGQEGTGISKWGSYYLATEEKYNYKEIINFYLKEDDIIISSKYIDDGGIANLEIKDTTNAQDLHERLDEFLESQGYSMDSINSFIMNNVEENGWGTRSGVVTAAVSLINYLYDNFKLKIPYYWGGSYQTIGVNPATGGRTNVSISSNGNPYYYTGFDCSGFVSWAIRNGGYNINRKTTYDFDVAFGHNSCNVTDSDCIGRPGDLINSKSCHVQLIVAVDEKSNSYYIAESGLGVTMTRVNMHSKHCDVGDTKIIFMDEFYENSANVDNSH